jgi:hypothetical protein
MTDKQDPMLLVERLKQIGEYRDYLQALHKFSVKLPESEKRLLQDKMVRIADILATEIDHLKRWHAQNRAVH